ncbi:aldose 1-epimerase family protein [Apilactobacillus xinyiensis]|uniref:aldose 1-epimerase family protein n=1 Tax=Apilactobacillus xinyiensis TaxID=2841032 RepID=UPI001C7CACB2|nr:aldose 1-epimerase family protein [Apilactobacillus xinyiensis]
MLVKLENEELTVLLNTKGAELTSVKDNKEHEYIWQADSKFWGRHAPVLFPIIGRLKDDFYLLHGNKYSMGQHGFARDNEFEVLEKNDNSVLFKLSENDETMSMYPYKFSLQIKYTLSNKTLSVDYIVKNNDTKLMYYSIGAHPAFNLSYNMENYKITINDGGSYKHIPLNKSLSDFEDTDELNANEPIRLNREFFKDDAKIIDTSDNSINSFVLSNDKDNHKIKVNAFNCKYTGIWSTYPKDGSFVCIEPWWGIADTTSHNHEINTKVGINELMPTKSNDYNLNIEFI